MLSGDVVRYDKLQGECCLPGFQRDAFRIADVFGKNTGFVIRTYDFIEKLQFGDYYRWGIGIVLQQFRAECGKAVYASEVHLAIGSAVAGRGVELIALQSVRFGEVAEFLRFRIEA